MPTNPQPLFTEGFCPMCLRYFFAVHVKDDNPQGINHACGTKFKTTWRRLVILGEPLPCPICQMPTYREVTGTNAKGEPISEPDKPAASFVIVNSTITRHMCEVPLTEGGEPSGMPLHPDDVTATKVNPG